MHPDAALHSDGSFRETHLLVPLHAAESMAANSLYHRIVYECLVQPIYGDSDTLSKLQKGILKVTVRSTASGGSKVNSEQMVFTVQDIIHSNALESQIVDHHCVLPVADICKHTLYFAWKKGALEIAMPCAKQQPNSLYSKLVDTLETRVLRAELGLVEGDSEYVTEGLKNGEVHSFSSVGWHCVGAGRPPASDQEGGRSNRGRIE